MMMASGASAGSGNATGEKREAECGADEGQQSDGFCFHRERRGKEGFEMATAGHRSVSARSGKAREPPSCSRAGRGWNQALGGARPVVGGLSISGVPPFDFFDQLLEQGLRPVAAGKAVAGLLEQLEAQRAAHREAPPLVVTVREAAFAGGGFAADDAGFVAAGFGVQNAGAVRAGVRGSPGAGRA